MRNPVGAVLVLSVASCAGGNSKPQARTLEGFVRARRQFDLLETERALQSLRIESGISAVPSSIDKLPVSEMPPGTFGFIPAWGLKALSTQGLFGMLPVSAQSDPFGGGLAELWRLRSGQLRLVMFVSKDLAGLLEHIPDKRSHQLSNRLVSLNGPLRFGEGLEELDCDQLVIVPLERIEIEDFQHSREEATSVSITLLPRIQRLFPDSVQVRQGSQVIIHPLSNDHGDASTIEIAQRPSHGSALLLTSSAVVYRPDVGFIGVDRFTYTVANSDLPPCEVKVEILPDEVQKLRVYVLPSGVPEGARLRLTVGWRDAVVGQADCLLESDHVTAIPIELTSGVPWALASELRIRSKVEPQPEGTEDRVSYRLRIECSLGGINSRAVLCEQTFSMSREQDVLLTPRLIGMERKQ